MALEATTGTFTTGTGTTAIEVNLSFAPKLVFLAMTNATALDSTTQGMKFSFGAFTGTTNRIGLVVHDQDNVATTNGDAELRTNAVLGALTTSDSVEGLLDVSAMTGTSGGNGFTVVPDDAFASDYQVLYLALGGSDLSNQIVGSFTSSATGNQSVTGLGFQPDGIMLLGGRITAANTVENTPRMFLGWGTSSSNRGSVGIAARGGVAPSNTSSMTSTTRIATIRNAAASSLDSEWDLVSLDADGFTVSRSGSATSYVVGYVAWKGPQIALGTTTSRTDTNTTAISGLAFPPRAVMMLTSNNPTATETAYSADGRWGVGWATAAGGYSAFAFTGNGLNPTDTMGYTSDTTVVPKYNRTGANSWTNGGTMDLDSLDGSGFTLDQLTADSQNTLLLYMALGDAASAGGTQHKFAGKFGGKFTGKV